MPVGTQSNAAPPSTADRSEDPWRDTDPSTLDLETLLAILPAEPEDSPRSVAEDTGRPDLTGLSLDELLSLSITGDLTDLETAGEDAESGGVSHGDDGSAGQPEGDGQSRPLEDQGGARILHPYFDEALVGSLIGHDNQVFLDHMA